MLAFAIALALGLLKRESAPWWRGGTLHAGKVGEWVAATPENRLATAADWTAMIPAIKAQVTASRDPASIRHYADTLVRCVDVKAFGEGVAMDTKLNELVIACFHQLDWSYD